MRRRDFLRVGVAAAVVPGVTVAEAEHGALIQWHDPDVLSAMARYPRWTLPGMTDDIEVATRATDACSECGAGDFVYRYVTDSPMPEIFSPWFCLCGAAERTRSEIVAELLECDIGSTQSRLRPPGEFWQASRRYR